MPHFRRAIPEFLTSPPIARILALILEGILNVQSQSIFRNTRAMVRLTAARSLDRMYEKSSGHLRDYRVWQPEQ